MRAFRPTPVFFSVLLVFSFLSFRLSIHGSDGDIVNTKGSRSWKFDFGSARVKPGYLAVTDKTFFNETTGYGFIEPGQLKAIDRGGDAVKGDFITSDHPFYFSVALPDGNYDIKLVLGDSKANSATTVRVENRRLLLENEKTKKGEWITRSLTVHVKDSLIRDAGGNVINKVRLKARERNYRHWDNLLTIEFNDSLPKVCALEITPNATATTLFLAGNSTVVDQDREPWAAWGQMFPVFLQPGKAVVANYAESGETMKAFKGERRLEKIWQLAKPGDYLFIEFTHNDQKAGGNHLDPYTTYQETIREWIAGARKRKMHPVLVTSMHRRNFDGDGHIVNTLSDYPDAMRQTAEKEKVILIDLNAMSKTLYEAWGVEGSLRGFVHYPANTFPGQREALKDNTHFNPYGAYELAKCVVLGIKKSGSDLNAFLKKDIQFIDPSHPDPFDKFYWPPSGSSGLVKPDGN